MAESESGQDKTEEPTDKKKKDAREKGEIARSKELNTLAVMLAGAGGLLIYGGGLAQDLLEVMRLNFSLPREVLLSPGAMGQYLLHSGKIAIIAVQPVLITLLLAALIGPISLGGWLFAGSSLAPKFSRMNPANGIKRMFSSTAVIELLKALANERRLFILCQLLERELSVGELNEVLGLSQSALSQHLAVLRRDELVATRKEAQTVYYSLRSHEVREMIGLLHRLYCSEPK